MLCDQCFFIVVEYGHAFPEPRFQPCLVLVSWVDTEGHTGAMEAYRVQCWGEVIDDEHREYLEALIEDWTATTDGGVDIQQLIEQLQHVSVGPIRMGEHGRTDRAGLDALRKKVLGTPGLT